MKGVDLSCFSEEVKQFLELSRELKEKIDTSLGLSLENVESYEDITENTTIILDIKDLV